MLGPKEYAFIAGLVLFFLGLGCLPLGGPGISPKRDLSLFNNYADLGAFASTGGVLIAAGVLVLLLTGFCLAFAAAWQHLTTALQRTPAGGDAEPKSDVRPRQQSSLSFLPLGRYAP